MGRPRKSATNNGAGNKVNKTSSTTTKQTQRQSRKKVSPVKTPTKTQHHRHHISISNLASLSSASSSASTISIHSPLSSASSTPSLTMSSPLFDSSSSPSSMGLRAFEFGSPLATRSLAPNELVLNHTMPRRKVLGDAFEEENLFAPPAMGTFTMSTPRKAQRSVSLVVQNGRAKTIDELEEEEEEEEEEEDEGEDTVVARSESDDALLAFQKAIGRSQQSSRASSLSSTPVKLEELNVDNYYQPAGFCPSTPKTNSRGLGDKQQPQVSTPKNQYIISPLMFDTPSRINPDAFDDSFTNAYGMISF